MFGDIFGKEAAYEKGKAEGLKEGIEQGYEQGINKCFSSVLTAIALLQSGCDVEETSKKSNLSKDLVMVLDNQLQNNTNNRIVLRI